MRIALGVEYVGKAYMGWERQKHGATVQAALEAALAKVANHPVITVCAGRTDSGVHAYGQVVHFDAQYPRPESAWLKGTNSYLPDDIVVRWVRFVGDEFHARFKAQARAYRYVIYCDPVAPAIGRGLVTWEYRSLDTGLMDAASQYLLGEHNFEAYRARSCQAHSPVRTIQRIGVARSGALVVLDVQANGFLHHMVRNIAGVLMAVGMGKEPPAWAQAVLLSEDRTCAGVTAPPHGLYFIGVQYPREFGIPFELPATPALW